MSSNGYPIRANFGLLPEPQKSPASFITSAAINLTILGVVLYIGMTAKRVIETHKFEQTELIFPTTPPPPPMKLKIPPPPKIEPPKPEVKLEAPKINLPKPEPKPDVKPVNLEAKMKVPVVKEAKPSVILAPQPKAALTAAAPAQVTQVKPSTAPVHLGETFGVTPNPGATKPATVAAIGNPYGGMNGPAVAPRGVVGSTGIGNGTKSGSNAGVVGHVASAGIPGATGTGNGTSAYGGGKVASAGIPAMQQAAVATPAANAVPKSTNLEVLSKPPVQYTAEARQLRVQGDVVLRVTFTANGQVIIQGVVHGLGHGLDEEARRVAQQIRFRPATRNGQAVDLTTNITITFQLA
ncbi:energy transducer TonB [Occallatibacter riparius]|uniref:Energy transducer TonB n=1 Tax=Occallatibacter riparius TaxID=1002689 RepID=A0A9J7BH91_9BACT|nr:energy transducer TonB [Occallatibacter riparius]UWZ82095.1 energy transducer TonB [Occallatibacter riparius]